MSANSNMQVGLLPAPPINVPVTDVEKMRQELKRIHAHLDDIKAKRATPSTYESILRSLEEINNLVDLIDNANDFYKIGGFAVLSKLLSMKNDAIRAATAELIADLVQNNTYCQSKVLETELGPKLLKLLKSDENVTVCVKALYALSCLCRSNHEAAVMFERIDGLPVLLQVFDRPVERLQTKAAFLLSHLVTHEPSVRDTLYDVGFVQKLANLVKEGTDSSQEHLLRTLLTLVEHHNPSKELCSKLNSLKNVLESNVRFYEGKPEHEESKEYCIQLLNTCFNVKNL